MTCTNCCGTGRIRVQQGIYMVERNCPVCWKERAGIPEWLGPTADPRPVYQALPPELQRVIDMPTKPRAVENEFAPDPKLIEHCER